MPYEARDGLGLRSDLAGMLDRPKEESVYYYQLQQDHASSDPVFSEHILF